MTHLKIEQNNGLIEEVSSAVISRLYDIVHSGNLDNTSNLIGRLHTSATYQDYIDYLEDTFKVGDVKLLIIDSTKKYIKFADSEVLRVLINRFGDGVGVTLLDMSSLTELPLRLFGNNTTITSFNELGQFTSIKKVGQYGFFGCSSLSSIDLSNMTTIEIHSFEGCTSLTSVDLSSCTSIGNSSFAGCTSLTTIDLSNVASIGSDAFHGCTSLGLGQTLELNLTNQTEYPHDGLASSKYTRLILHSPQLLGTYDPRYPVYEGMRLLLYLDLSDWRPAKSAGSNSLYGDASFYDNDSLVTYIAPITVNNIGTIIGQLGGYSNFRYLILLSTTPPTITTTDHNNPPDYWFYGRSGHVDIYVPDSAKAAYLADTYWVTIGGYDGSDTITDRLHGLSELPAGVWTTGLASQYLTPALLATS